MFTEAKERKGCSALVKSLILVIALLIVCCLVLLNLYLTEREKNPKTGATEKRLESTSRSPELEKYYGGSCWTTDCLHAASGKSVLKFNLSFIYLSKGSH